MDNQTRLPAYILAGGRSRRFGSDKARAVLHGQPLVVRIADALRQFSASVTVVADVPGRYGDLGLRTIADRVPGSGPLGGLDAAIADAAQDGWLLIASCDLVVVRPQWLSRLIEAAAPGGQVVAFRHERWEPLLALYHTSIAPLVQAQINSAELAMWRMIEQTRAQAVPLPEDWPIIAQANTPADLEKAQAVTGRISISSRTSGAA
jgi:molybdenum cofactor guanylyltransferase